MKSKILNLGLILTSFMGYLEWGGDNKMFLIQGEIEIISKLFNNPGSVIHPFTILPLAGQLLLVITLFQNPPSKILTLLGLSGMGLLLGFMFIIGLLGQEFKIALSTVPFLFVSFLTVKHYRATKSDTTN